MRHEQKRSPNYFKMSKNFIQHCVFGLSRFKKEEYMCLGYRIYVLEYMLRIYVFRLARVKNEEYTLYLACVWSRSL